MPFRSPAMVFAVAPPSPFLVCRDEQWRRDAQMHHYSPSSYHVVIDNKRHPCIHTHNARTFTFSASHMHYSVARIVVRHGWPSGWVITLATEGAAAHQPPRRQQCTFGRSKFLNGLHTSAVVLLASIVGRSITACY